MRDTINTGTCAICGKFKKLTFEHVPPQAAFNNKPMFVQTSEHLINRGSHLFGKRMKSNRGAGGYTLCEQCNNNTGDWYAKDFADFTQQGMEIIKKTDLPYYLIKGKYEIKPLNVIKQILAMFMSADKMGYLRSQKDLVKLILRKEEIRLPTRFKIYLYSTLSAKKRMIGYTLVNDENNKIQKWSEINFDPFGYFLTEDSDPANINMIDISSFSNYSYDEQATIEITTPYLKIISAWIGLYD